MILSKFLSGTRHLSANVPGVRFSSSLPANQLGIAKCLFKNRIATVDETSEMMLKSNRLPDFIT